MCSKLSTCGKCCPVSDGAPTLSLGGQVALLSEFSAYASFDVVLAFLGLLISILPFATSYSVGSTRLVNTHMFSGHY
ncbi:hypothetical protein BDV93DRAFT_518812 [Ceratobasidium sp. AG-I]|nr:hypothetical protein BDV93DRAFT_518812 [Ceratobasidium sp. AG-I]